MGVRDAEDAAIAFIVDAAVIDKILRHLVAKGDHRVRGPPGRADLEAAS